ncbi:MAG: hypothetical protein OCD02_08875 [Spirochaetaceae bacterium]
MKCYSICIILILITSCSKSYKVNELNLYSGVSEIIKLENNNFVFLANLTNFNNIITLNYISDSGELINVYPLDKYTNTDVQANFIKLVNQKNQLTVFYENKGQEIIAESFNNLLRTNYIKFIRDKSSYGSIFKIENNAKPIFIRSKKNYVNTKHSNYKYNYFLLNNKLEVLENHSIDLGEYFPRGITVFNDKIIYFIDDSKLFFYNIKDKQHTPIYQFKNDILDIKIISDKMLILLFDVIYIVNKSGEVTKSFKLIKKGSSYSANKIIETNNNVIVVQFNSENGSMFKSFNVHGIQMSEYFLKENIFGDSYHYKSENSTSFFYSTADSLFFKDF